MFVHMYMYVFLKSHQRNNEKLLPIFYGYKNILQWYVFFSIITQTQILHTNQCEENTCFFGNKKYFD